MTTIRQNYQVIAAIAFLLGVGLITVAEAPRLDWMRAFGAAAITFGAIGVGIYLGFSQPGRYVALKSRLSVVKQPLAVATIVVLFLPALAGLLAGLIGLVSGPDGASWVMATGVVVLTMMLVATVVALIVGLGAARAGGRSTQSAVE